MGKFTISQAKGATLIEILISIAITLIIAMIAITSFSEYRTRKTLDASLEEVMSAFSKAYFDTVASRYDMQYGVHIQSDMVVVFPGNTYNSSVASNTVYAMYSTNEIANISLVGGGSDVVFSRIYGTTTQSGTFDVRSKSNTSKKYTVTVNPSGVVSFSN